MSKSKKKSVTLTNHSKKRANQRAGITKNQLNMMATRALKDGIKHSEATNELKSWMDAEYFKYETANNCRFYANKLYIFHNTILITVLDAPLYYEQNLRNYVANIKIYIAYKRNRIKHKSNFNELSKTLLNEVMDEIAIAVRDYLNKSLINKDTFRYTYSHINYGGFQVVIKYTNMTTNDKEKYIPEINKYIKDTFGLDTAYKKQPKLDYLMGV